MIQLYTTIIVPVLLFVLWQMQAFNEGKEEGMFYSCKYKSRNKQLRLMDEHTFWTYQRMIIASGFISQYISALWPSGVDWVGKMAMTLMLSVSYILVFSFWHNGSLYTHVNRYRDPGLEIPYPGGWKADQDGKAVFDFPWKIRKLLFIAGWLLFILFIILNIDICGGML